MSDILVTAKCEAGHEQAVRFEASMGLGWATEWAMLMDGTSPFYVRSPIGDPDSAIGKCGICRAQIKCSVSEVDSLAERVSALEQNALANVRLGPTPKQDEDLERERDETVKRILESVPGPVDRSRQILTDGSPVPEDRSHAALRSDGQQQGYVVLSDGERSKGFVRPYRDAYRHLKCGKITTMGRKIAETYARDPRFYSGTFCVTCAAHFPVGEGGEFVWYEMDGSTGPKVGT
jgi:hypothetical protein